MYKSSGRSGRFKERDTMSVRRRNVAKRKRAGIKSRGTSLNKRPSKLKAPKPKKRISIKPKRPVRKPTPRKQVRKPIRKPIRTATPRKPVRRPTPKRRPTPRKPVRRPTPKRRPTPRKPTPRKPRRCKC